jgi:hypothetical protein
MQPPRWPERVGAGPYCAADASPLLNSRLATRDDAAFGLAVAGAGRPVAFLERARVRPGQGGGALPGRFRGALVLLALAGGVLMLARGRRLGLPARRAELAGSRRVRRGFGAPVRAEPAGDRPVLAEAGAGCSSAHGR